MGTAFVCLSSSRVSICLFDVEASLHDTKKTFRIDKVRRHRQRVDVVSFMMNVFELWFSLSHHF